MEPVNENTDVKQFLKIDSPIRFLGSNTDTQWARLVLIVLQAFFEDVSRIFTEQTLFCMKPVIPQYTEGNNTSKTRLLLYE